VGGIDEIHLPPAPAGLLQPRFQLLLKESGLLPCVLFDRFLGRDGDCRGLAPTQPQLVLEEVAYLSEAAADAGLSLDDGLSLLGGARRMRAEILLQGIPVPGQVTTRLTHLTATEAWQTAFEVIIKVALDGPSGNVGVGGDRVVAQAVALEPEHLPLALDARVGVMVSVMGQGPSVVGRKANCPHDWSA
jgi:hypothetical protein